MVSSQVATPTASQTPNPFGIFGSASGGEDAVLVAQEYFSTLDNVAAEVGFLLGEIDAKDKEIADTEVRIAARQVGLTKSARKNLLKQVGGQAEASNGTNGAQAGTSQRDKGALDTIQAEFRKVDELQSEKLEIAERLAAIVRRHRERGRDEWRKIAGPDGVEQWDEAMRKTIEEVASASNSKIPNGSTAKEGNETTPKSKKADGGATVAHGGTLPSTPEHVAAAKRFLSTPSASLPGAALQLMTTAVSALTASGGNPSAIPSSLVSSAKVGTPVGSTLIGHIMGGPGGIASGKAGLTPSAMDERALKKRKMTGSGTPSGSGGTAYFDMLPPAVPGSGTGNTLTPSYPTPGQPGRKKPQSSSDMADFDMDFDDGEGNEDDIYCICREKSYGQMIGCDNDDCRYEWFHLKCVGVTEPLPDKWFCPDCVEMLNLVDSTGTKKKSLKGRKK